MPPRKTTQQARLPGAFAGETVTRRRLMTGTAHVAGAVAAAAAALPAIGFAVGPAFEREPTTWQPIGPASDFTASTYVPRVIRLTQDDVGEAALTTIFVRRRDPEIDTEPADEWNRYIALTSRCAHVGCPVGYKEAARTFVCPCHGGVYDFRGVRTGGPPPRPLDRFFTRVRQGRLEIGPRYSVNSRLERFAPRDPGEALDGIGRYVYPPRFTTPKLPSR
jgi:menaquinol-cytochrome c reductase iron-sulfur subunit